MKVCELIEVLKNVRDQNADIFLNDFEYDCELKRVANVNGNFLIFVKASDDYEG